MYNYAPAPGSLQTPADHFFTTFFLFGSAAWEVPVEAGMRELQRRALDENVSYLELMLTSATAAKAINASDYERQLLQAQAARDEGALTQLLDAITSTAVTPQALQQAVQDYVSFVEQAHRAVEPEGGVTVRFQAYATRTLPPMVVFGQLLCAFAAAASSELVVGVNLVAQENAPVALRDFWLHMRMFRYLKRRYPGVHVALHAGEMVLGMVPPEELRFHIHDAVEVAGASRIGHGVDVEFERNATALLQRMADQGVALEINLSSNAFILGADRDLHPNALYLDSDVPCVISSDDPGILRGSLTEEYVRLFNAYPYITYRQVKQLARNSIAYSFIKDPALKRALAQDLDARFLAFEQAVLAEAEVQNHLP